MNKSKQFLRLLFFVSFLLVSLKIDYRFVESIVCCQDDHDYYSHSETLAIDRDFNYDNQLEGFENKRFNNNGKIAPKGFIGTGILSAPFLFIGNFLDKLVERFNLFENNIYNFKILFYSFSSIFYFFTSIYLIFKTINRYIYKIKIEEIILIFFGSGLSYFAFERYSMTHTFEAFTVSLIIFLSYKYYKEEDNESILGILIPLAILIGLLVRWVNYYLFLLPYLCKLIIKSEKSLIKNKNFILSTGLSVSLFGYLSYLVYGLVTFNPQFIYGKSNIVSGILTDQNLVSFLIENIKNFFIVLFTEEFGIFWFSSPIFVGLLVSLITFFSFTKERKIGFISLLIYMQNFALVLLWKSTASSYGFRYLFSLVPFSIFIFYFFYKKHEFKVLRYYLLFFSFFGALSILFYETTPMTQLSLTEEVNSFGELRRFTEPQYLRGFLGSFLVLNSYLKIFTTSFLGILIFKVIFIFIPTKNFIATLESLGLPIGNEDFILLMEKIELIHFSKIFLSLFFLIVFAYGLLFRVKQKI